MAQPEQQMDIRRFRFYEFGEFCVDATRRALFKNGEEILLPAKAFELLLILAQNEGRVLTHDYLLDTLWQGTFVEQNSLKKAVSALRKALNDSTENSLYIKTIPRQGYCLATPVRAFQDDGLIAMRQITEVEEIEEEIILEESDEQAIQAPRAADLLSAAPPAFFRRNFWKIGAAALLLAAIISSYLIIRQIGRSGQQAARLNAENFVSQKLTLEASSSGGIISPDGKYFLYMAFENGKTSLWLRGLDKRDTKQVLLPITDRIWGVVFTSDSQQIYYVSEEKGNTLYQISVLGGTPRKIIGGDIYSLPSFSPDGKRMVIIGPDPDTPGNTAIIQINAGDGGNLQVLLTSKAKLRSPFWSSDGQRIIYNVTEPREDGDYSYFAEIPSAGRGEPRNITEQFKQFPSDVHLLKDNSGILFSAQDPQTERFRLWLVSLPDGEIRQVMSDSFDYTTFSISDDGTKMIINQADRPADLWVLPEGKLKDAKKLPFVGTLYRLNWTLDGRILYVLVEDGKTHIWITDIDGGNEQQLSPPEAYDSGYLSVTPDNRYILFRSTRSGQPAFWRMELDGKNPKQLTPAGLKVGNTIASPDGKTIYFTCDKQGIWRICKMPFDGGEIEEVVATSGGVWAFSPDNTKLAYCFFDSAKKQWRTSVLSLGDNQTQATFEFGGWSYIGWMPDSQNLMYVSSNNQLTTQPLAGGEGKEYLKLGPEGILDARWSKDGKYLAILRGSWRPESILLTLRK